MSTKTSIKRVALIAVSALGFGLMSVIPASANTSRAATATVDPVRVSFTDGTQDVVPAAAVTTGTNADWTVDDLIGTKTASLTVTLTQAPSSAAVLTVTQPTGFGTAVDATAQLSGAASFTGTVDKVDGGNGFNLETVAAATTGIKFGANIAGTYKGTITIDGDKDAATDILVSSFSFTTTGKVATIKTDVAAVELPAVAVAGGNFVTSKVVTVTLTDTAGSKTQPSTGDTITVDITGSGTNISLAAGGATASATLTNANLADGSDTFTVGSLTAVADSETVTLTPLGVMPAQGVVAATLTAKTIGYGTETAVDTVLSSPSSSAVVVAGTGAGSEAAYLVDQSNTIYAFTVSGYTAGAAYAIEVLWKDAGAGNAGAANVKDDTSNTSTANLVSNTSKILYGIAGSTGNVLVTVTVTANNETGDFIKVNPESGNATFAEAADAYVLNASPAYRVKVLTPTVTPSMDKTGATITASGDVKDQYGNPIVGAVVTLLGEVTTTDASPANLTKTAVTDATGAWTATLSAATALTTKVELSATAAKTGITILDSTNVVANNGKLVVNLTASGSPATMTFTNVNADTQDPATATTAPVIRVIHDGAISGTSDESLTVSTGVLVANGGNSVLEGTDEVADFTPATDPGSQVVVTASKDVLLYKANSGSPATGVTTLTVASGTTVFAAAKTVGTHTVTFTSGTVSKTWTFYAKDGGQTNQGEVIRNLSVDKASLELNGGEYAFLTISATDAFGNAIKNAVAAGGASILVKATGSALLDGPALSRTYTTTDADGNIVVGVVAGQTAGTATITISGSGAQLGAVAGSLNTTAGTNGMTASTSELTVKVTVTGNAQDATEAAVEATDAANQAYEAAIVATETAEAAVAAAEDAKAAADAATAAVEALATQVSTMMAELKAQVTKLAKAVAKILKKV